MHDRSAAEPLTRRVPRTLLSHAAYHQSGGINCSGLDLVDRSLLHHWNGRIRPDRKPREPTPQMEFGTAFHAIIEGEEVFRSLYAQAPDCRRGTKEWAAAEAANPGKMLLKPEQMAKLEEMRAVFLGHPFLRTMIFNAPPGADAPCFEETFYWEHIEDRHAEGKTVHVCKGRADIYVPGMCIVDIKVSHDARAHKFEKTCMDFGYHRRAAWYVDGIFKVTGELLPYVFAVIEDEAPHAISVFVASPRMLELGRKDNARLMDQLLWAKRTGIWSGYPEAVREVNLPGWAEKQIENAAIVDTIDGGAEMYFENEGELA